MFSDSLKRKKAILLIVLAGLLARVLIALGPYEWVVCHVLSGDSFLYLKVTENILNGCGPGLNCGEIGTGFHPLWVLITGILFVLPREIIPRAIIIFSALFDAITTFLIFKVASKAFTKQIGLIAAAIFSLSPILIFRNNIGLETPLLMVLMALLMYVYVCMNESNRKWMYMGIIGGLLGLARTDTAFIVGLIALDVLYMRFIKKKGNVAMKGLMLFLIISGSIASTWILYNYAALGKLGYTSLDSNLLWSKKGWGRMQNMIGGLDVLGSQELTLMPVNLGKSLSPILFLYGAPLNMQKMLINGAFTLLLMGVLAYAFLREKKKFRVFYPFILFWPTLMIVYSVMGIPNIRYFMSSTPMLMIMLAVGISWMLKDVKKRGPFVKAMVSIMALAVLANLLVGTMELALPQGEEGKMQYDAAIWAKANIEDGALIASYGTMAFFSGRDVQELGGLFSYDVTQALIDDRLYEHIQGSEIDYIAIFEDKVDENLPLGECIKNFTGKGWDNKKRKLMICAVGR